ncbi:hypothetical protein HMPREF9080_02267 [Cardiobacterium valvarum F0432]|uniref:Uncharacterized protein n=1 Tax=Cardiobacterium valvarum F0432 TaxID=797473 RepID=G9ZHK9_9GAMM|nr:hypothetical protein HMPREF9080_02267 [Cardiobacterium valvarum F0432]
MRLTAKGRDYCHQHIQTTTLPRKQKFSAAWRAQQLRRLVPSQV